MRASRQPDAGSRRARSRRSRARRLRQRRRPRTRCGSPSARERRPRRRGATRRPPSHERRLVRHGAASRTSDRAPASRSPSTSTRERHIGPGWQADSPAGGCKSIACQPPVSPGAEETRRRPRAALAPASSAVGACCQWRPVRSSRMRPVTDLERRVAPFEVKSDYQPVRRPADGDRGDREADPGRGEGRRAARRDRHRQDRDRRLGGRAAAAADPGDAAQQDAGRPVRQRAAPAVPRQRGRVLRLLLRLLPARGLRPADRHLHREGLLDQRGGRAAAALGDQLAADPARRDRGLDGVLHLRPRHPAGVRRPDAPAQGRQRDGPRRRAAPARRDPVHPQRPLLHPRHLPGPRRHPRDLPGLRGARRPGGVLRRRDRAADDAAPGHRRGAHRGQRGLRLPGHPLRRRPGADGAGDQRHRGRARGAGRLLREAGQAARGAAAADAHDLRRGDDAPGRLLLRHRELLDAHRRPQPRERPQLPARLLPRGLRARRRRVPRRGAADRRHVRRRHVPQAQPGRPRLPAAERDGQPAAAVGGVPRPDRPDDLPLGDPGRLRDQPRAAASTTSSSRSSGPPAWSTPR